MLFIAMSGSEFALMRIHWLSSLSFRIYSFRLRLRSPPEAHDCQSDNGMNHTMRIMDVFLLALWGEDFTVKSTADCSYWNPLRTGQVSPSTLQIMFNAIYTAMMGFIRPGESFNT